MRKPSFRRPSSIGPAVAVAATAAIVIAVDQLSKWLIVRSLVEEGRGQLDLGVSWLAMIYVENRGAAFGILQGYSDYLLPVAVILVIGITLMFSRLSGASPFLPFATGLIVGGAIGNIIDRVRLGFVIDFVAVGPWPKFNVADSAISIGVALMIWAMLFGGDQAGDRGAAMNRSSLRQIRD